MKGSMKIVLGALALILLLSTLASAKEEVYAIPIVKIVKTGYSVIRYDKVLYYFSSPVSLSVTFDKIDDRYVEVVVKPIDFLTPTIAVSLWWGDFPVNSLGLEAGGDNSWTLDTETGYAEK
jgi:hypothetical protein